MNQFVVRAMRGRLYLEEWHYCRFGTNYQPRFVKWL